MGKKIEFSIIEVQQWLQSRIRTCSLCGSSAWDMDPELYKLHLGKAGAPHRSRQSKRLELVLLSCTNCGMTQLIDTDRLCKAARAEAHQGGTADDSDKADIKLQEEEMPGFHDDDASFVVPQKEK